MHKTMMIAAIAACALCGCRTVSVENEGEGKGWKVSVMSNMMKSEVDNIKATVNPDGTISFDMGGLASSPSEEFAKSLATFTYIARLAATLANPAAASVPLSEAAADPHLAAQAAGKASVVKAKAERSSAINAGTNTCATGTCTDGSCQDCEEVKK